MDHLNGITLYVFQTYSELFQVVSGGQEGFCIEQGDRGVSATCFSVSAFIPSPLDQFRFGSWFVFLLFVG